MSISQRSGLAFALIVGVVFAGCGKTAPAPAQPATLSTSQDLMAAWSELPREGTKNLDVVSAQTIAKRMLNTPEGLQPVMDYLAAPDSDPVGKVLALITLSPHVKPEMAPAFTAMTQTGNETTTRACATHLLGLLDTPEAKARVREMLADPEHRVKTAAIMVLGARGDQAVIDSMPALWTDPETTAEDRDQIIYMLPEEHVRQHLDVYKNAIVDPVMEPKARERFASILGRVGDASVIPLLEEAAEKDPVPEVRVLARSAVDAINSRLAGSAPAVEPVSPVDAAPPEGESTPPAADTAPVTAPEAATP